MFIYNVGAIDPPEEPTDSDDESQQVVCNYCNRRLARSQACCINGHFFHFECAAASIEGCD